MAMNVTFAQSFSKSQTLKSLIVPGWGQRSLGELRRGEYFVTAEVFTILSAVMLNMQVKHNYEAMSLFAVQNAGIVNPNGKTERFYDDIGNYTNMSSYNEDALRRRQYFDLYSEPLGFGWSWNYVENETNYKRIKADYYQSKRNLSYAFGAIALNHVLSGVDALLLSKTKVQLHSVSLLSHNLKGIQISFTF